MLKGNDLIAGRKTLLSDGACSVDIPEMGVSFLCEDAGNADYYTKVMLEDSVLCHRFDVRIIRGSAGNFWVTSNDMNKIKDIISFYKNR